MYEIYETKAYVLRSYLSKENDIRVLFFTEDFGLLWASASGAKKEVSKFRNFLQNLTELKIFLVRGKSGYRVTGGNFIDNIYFNLKKKKTSQLLFKKKVIIIKSIFSLLEKVFLHNEADRKVFKILEDFLKSLDQIDDQEVLKEREVIFLSKLFYFLGYFDEGDLLEKPDENLFSSEKHFSEKEIVGLRKKINNNLLSIAF